MGIGKAILLARSIRTDVDGNLPKMILPPSLPFQEMSEGYVLI
jgi:hypothetical protein